MLIFKLSCRKKPMMRKKRTMSKSWMVKGWMELCHLRAAQLKSHVICLFMLRILWNQVKATSFIVWCWPTHLPQKCCCSLCDCCRGVVHCGSHWRESQETWSLTQCEGIRLPLQLWRPFLPGKGLLHGTCCMVGSEGVMTLFYTRKICLRSHSK